MIKINLLFFFSLSLIFLTSKSVKAQRPGGSITLDTIRLYKIVKTDGSEYIGRIISNDSFELHMRTKRNKNLAISKSDIKRIKTIGRNTDFNEAILKTIPYSTRYSYLANAFPIEKGEIFTHINLLGPEVNYGLSDRFSVGLTSSWIAGPLMFSGKASIETGIKNVNLSIGSYVFSSGTLSKFRGYGALPLLNLTIGDRLKNLTLSAGYLYYKAGEESRSYYEGTYYNISSPYLYIEPNPDPVFSRPYYQVDQGAIFSISGYIKTSKKVSFVFVSMYFREEYIYNSVKSTKIKNGYYDPITLNYVNPLYNVTVTNRKETIGVLFIMPGIRFQNSDRKALQISLALFSGFDNVDGNIYLPIPNITWFRKF